MRARGEQFLEPVKLHERSHTCRIRKLWLAGNCFLKTSASELGQDALAQGARVEPSGITYSICIYARVYVHICIHTYYVYMYICVNMYICIFIYMCIGMYVHVYVYMCILPRARPQIRNFSNKLSYWKALPWTRPQTHNFSKQLPYWKALRRPQLPPCALLLFFGSCAPFKHLYLTHAA